MLQPCCYWFSIFTVFRSWAKILGSFIIALHLDHSTQYSHPFYQYLIQRDLSQSTYVLLSLFSVLLLSYFQSSPKDLVLDMTTCQGRTCEKSASPEQANHREIRTTQRGPVKLLVLYLISQPPPSPLSASQLIRLSSRPQILSASSSKFLPIVCSSQLLPLHFIQ